MADGSNIRIWQLLWGMTSIMLLASCLDGELPRRENKTEPVIKSAPVPPDGTLETVTWNLEWFGSASHGPNDDELQIFNVVEVMDSLRADLYALQELYSQTALEKLLNRLSGYRGFVAGHIDGNQKTAFVYNTAVIDSVSAGAITEGQNSYDWANGRYPLYFRFTYYHESSAIPVYAIVIHGKANTGDATAKEEAYQRRKRAAVSLHSYLEQEHSDANILLLGDFNDDVDASIFDGESPSPYLVFFENENTFKAVTQSISKAGQSSYLPGQYTDLIDHIIISDELFSSHITSSEEIYFSAIDFIENFEQTTSDHLPVWSKFNVSLMQLK
jgi:exonuclease III